MRRKEEEEVSTEPYNDKTQPQSCTPPSTVSRRKQATREEAVQNQCSHIALPLGRKELLLNSFLGKRMDSSVLFCYPLKLSVILHILLEIIWFHSFPPH